MRKIIILLSVCFITSCVTYEKVRATKNEGGHLVGYANKKDFQQECNYLQPLHNNPSIRSKREGEGAEH